MPGADTPWKEITLHFSTEHTKQHSIGETLWLGFYMSPWKGNRCFNSINRKVSGPYDSVDSKKLQSSHSAWDQIGYCGIVLPPYYLICVTYFLSLTPTYRIYQCLGFKALAVPSSHQRNVLHFTCWHCLNSHSTCSLFPSVNDIIWQIWSCWLASLATTTIVLTAFTSSTFSCKLHTHSWPNGHFHQQRNND